MKCIWDQLTGFPSTMQEVGRKTRSVTNLGMNSAEKFCDLVLYLKPAFDESQQALRRWLHAHFAASSSLLISRPQKTPQAHSSSELENAFFKRSQIVTEWLKEVLFSRAVGGNVFQIRWRGFSFPDQFLSKLLHSQDCLEAAGCSCSHQDCRPWSVAGGWSTHRRAKRIPPITW